VVPVLVASGQPHADGRGIHPACVGLGVVGLGVGVAGGVVGAAVVVVGATVGDGGTVALGDGEAVCVALGVGVGLPAAMGSQSARSPPFAFVEIRHWWV